MRLTPSQESKEGAKDRSASDFSNLMKDAEELLRTTSGYAGEGVAQARKKFEDRLEQIKSKIPEAESYALRKYRRAATNTDQYVRDNPWQVVGAVAAAGILIGFLTGRR